MEATLFLPMFLFAFLSIYNLINFARAQVIIQYAADQAVKEVAEYTYLLDKTGILENVDSVHKDAEAMKKELEELGNNLQVIENAVKEVPEGSIKLQDFSDAGNVAMDSYDQIKGYIEKPEDFLRGVSRVLKSEGLDALSAYMVNQVGLSCIKKQLSIASGSSAENAYEAYLKKLNITKLDTSGNSSWCEGQSRDIRLIVDFYVTNDLPYFHMEPRHYRVCASTRAWSGV